MANLPGTIWQKVSQFGQPPTWVQVGNFAQGIKGNKGDTVKGDPGLKGDRGPAGPSLLPRGFIDGFVMSNDAGFTDGIDFAAGMAADSTNNVAIQLSSTMLKLTSGAWAAGNSGNGLFTGSVVPTSTILHCFVIAKADGTTDAGFDTSVTAAHIPSGYIYYRRVGSVLTDTQPHVRLFHQYGDEFWYDTLIRDINTTNTGTAAVTATLTVPTGIKVAAIFSMISYDSTQNTQHYVSSLDKNDEAASFANAIEQGSSNTVNEAVSVNRIWTNTSAQIRYRVSQTSASQSVKIGTHGWVDQRGKNS